MKKIYKIILTILITLTMIPIGVSAEENALDNSTKSSFTITSKYKCEEGNLGSRGIVHRFRLVSVTIK